jgi:hypothetical protein
MKQGMTDDLGALVALLGRHVLVHREAQLRLEGMAEPANTKVTEIGDSLLVLDGMFCCVFQIMKNLGTRNDLDNGIAMTNTRRGKSVGARRRARLMTQG